MSVTLFAIIDFLCVKGNKLMNNKSLKAKYFHTLLILL